ncbi:MAG: hypothetical protein AB1679_36470 [Actinomycetota bacterium]|jgi:hypothetical protein
MLRLPFARRALMGATACSLVVLPVVLLPSPARAEAPNPSACRGLYRGDPPGSLAITSNPPSGSVLHPGDTVEVTATWDTADWPRPVLHKVLDCLLVNGEVDYGLSTQEKPTDNDGLYGYTFTVPGRAVGGRICDRVRLSGRLVDGGPLAVQKSNTICFSVEAAGGTGPTVKPAEITTGAATPEVGSPAPLQPAAPAPESPVEDVAAPAMELSSVAVPTLPRTGTDPLPLVRLGVLLVGLGATALAARTAMARA